MISESEAGARQAVNPFAAEDVAAILRARSWLRAESEAASSWMTEAAALLGPRAADREALAGLLKLVFEYDAHAVLAARASQEVLSRAGAREVLRALATEILSGGPVDSNLLKEIVNALKARLPYRSREIFLPFRVAVAGRTGDGALDRVILLLDRAAQIEGFAPVKSVRARILEFCAALD
jgi:Anticodon binding domain